MRATIRTLIALLLAIGVISFLVLFIVIPYQVEEDNMAPTFQQDDRLILNKLAPRLNILHHGDVIVYQHEGQYRLGRLIGEPGRSVVFNSGQLELDNRPVEEPYASEKDNQSWSAETLPKTQSDIIPPQSYIVLNDQRQNKEDSRTFGLIRKEDIEGSVLLRYFPFDRLTVNFKS